MGAKAAVQDEGLFLTVNQLSDRWNGQVAVGTLNNWRGRNVGPPYVKVGKHKGATILYRLADIIEYERKMTRHTKGG